jgi:hypothetical protein
MVTTIVVLPWVAPCGLGILSLIVICGGNISHHKENEVQLIKKGQEKQTNIQ